MMLPQWVTGSQIFEKTHLLTLTFKDPTPFRIVGIRMPTARASCSRRIECSNQNRSRIGSQEIKYWWELLPCYLGRRSIDLGTALTWKCRCNFCVHDFGTPCFLNVSETYCNNKIITILSQHIYEFWGLFDRASSSWNNVKCQLHATK